MQLHQIQDTDKRIIFDGVFPSFSACLERAVIQSIDLSYADLSNKNLASANLDNGIFWGADFSGSNLTGTNLSESILVGASFEDASLFNTCFAYSDMTSANFCGSSFGATDIAGADLTSAIFSTLGCFCLDFSSASSMQGCQFIHVDGKICHMSSPPVVILGLSRMIAIMDDYIQAGSDLFPRSAWMCLLRDTLGIDDRSDV